MALEDLSENLITPPSEQEEESLCLSLSQRVWTESKKFWVVAGPSMFTSLSTVDILVITQAFMGHVGATELAAYALSFTVVDHFAVGIMVAIAKARVGRSLLPESTETSC